MHIGEIAGKAGISVRTVRYYEELGLIRPEGHSSGGFRLYTEESLKRLQVIGFLKELGLSLSEISGLFNAKKPPGADRETVRTLLCILGEKLQLVESKLASLGRIRDELAHTVRILGSCESCDHPVLLDSAVCGDCASLSPRESVPDTLTVILSQGMDSIKITPVGG